MEHFLTFVLNLVDTAGYFGLFIVMVLGNLAVPVGTEVVLPTAGALAATGHLPSAFVAAVVATCGEVVGGSILYAVGRYGGHAFVHRFGKYVHLREAELARVHQFYERYGAKTVFISRFIPVIRGIAALPAGLSKMSWRTYLSYTTAGSLIFCFGLVYIGHSLGRHFDKLQPLFHRLGLTVALAAVVIAVIIVLISRRSKHNETVG